MRRHIINWTLGLSLTAFNLAVVYLYGVGLVVVALAFGLAGVASAAASLREAVDGATRLVLLIGPLAWAATWASSVIFSGRWRLPPFVSYRLDGYIGEAAPFALRINHLIDRATA